MARVSEEGSGTRKGITHLVIDRVIVIRIVRGTDAIRGTGVGSDTGAGGAGVGTERRHPAAGRRRGHHHPLSDRRLRPPVGGKENDPDPGNGVLIAGELTNESLKLLVHSPPIECNSRD